MISLNYLLRKIRETAEAHSQVNKYAQGQRYDIGADTALSYPCIWAVPNGAVPNLKGRIIDHSITLIIMDIEENAGENEIEILNDTAMILTDIMAKLREVFEDEDEIEIFALGNLVPFVGSFNDKVAGYTCDLTLSTFYAADVCTDIFDEEEPPTIHTLWEEVADNWEDIVTNWESV